MPEYKSPFSKKDTTTAISRRIDATRTVVSDLEIFRRRFNSPDTVGKEISEVNRDLVSQLLDLLNQLKGGHTQFKNVLTRFYTQEAKALEPKIKELIYNFYIGILSCGNEATVNEPFGVVDTPIGPAGYPQIDQFDFYGLLRRDLSDPNNEILFDKNFDTVLKQHVDAGDTAFTWKQHLIFTANYATNTLKVDVNNSTTLPIKQFVRDYLDSINILPPESVIKYLVDSMFGNISGPNMVEYNTRFSKFLNFGLKHQRRCGGNREDDRHKSTMDIGYEDFKPVTVAEDAGNPELLVEQPPLQFGSVDYGGFPTQPELTNNPQLVAQTTSTVIAPADLNGSNTTKEGKLNNLLDATQGTTFNQNFATQIQSPDINAQYPNFAAHFNLGALTIVPSLIASMVFRPKLVLLSHVVYRRLYNIGTPAYRALPKTVDEYFEFQKTLFLQIVREVYTKILKMIFNLVKLEIIKLIKQLVVRILSEKLAGYLSQIKQILAILAAIGQLAKSAAGALPIKWDNCKSVLENLLNLFQIPNFPPGPPVPPPLVLIGGFGKSGMSATQASTSAIEGLQARGFNFRDNEDGSENRDKAMIQEILKAAADMVRNAKVDVAAPAVAGFGAPLVGGVGTIY